MKTVFPVLLLSVLFLLPTHDPAWTFSGSGSGTESDPFVITNVYELQEMNADAAHLSAHYVLGNDIDASETLTWNGGAGFEPVGARDLPFSGFFDGRGHLISNLTINRPTRDCVGLFGSIDGATVRNLGLESSSVTGKNRVGGLIGSIETGKVFKCYANCTVFGNDSVGCLVGSGHMWDCYASGSVTGRRFVGGLVGRSNGTTRCYAAVAVVATSKGGYPQPSLAMSYYDKEISGGGGFFGATGKSTAEMYMRDTYEGWDFHKVWFIDEGKDYPRFYWEARTPEPPSFSGEGKGTSASPYVITDVTQLQQIAINPSASYVLGNDIEGSSTSRWHRGVGLRPIGDTFFPFSGGLDGRGFTIKNLYINRPSMDYVGLFGYMIGGDVRNLGLNDFNITGSNYVGGIVGFSMDGNLTKSFGSGVAVGKDHVGGLAGSLHNGQVSECQSVSHTVGEDYVGGLAGSLDNGQVSECQSVSQTVGENYVGGIAGYIHSGGVAICSGTTTIYGTDFVGGMVGLNRGKMDRSIWTGEVTGVESVGGLIGENSFDTPITECAAKGEIRGSSNVGGLVGKNSGRVTFCYSDSVVSGTEYIGGLVGITPFPGSIGNCYAKGTIIGGEVVGGLVGSYPHAIFRCYSAAIVSGFGRAVGGLAGSSTRFGFEPTSSYWDTDTSGLAISSDGEGKTTLEMFQEDTFIGWDFKNIWFIDEGKDYPRFYWQSDTPDRPTFSGEGFGSESSPYVITSVTQLQEIDLDYGAWYVLGKDIDASETQNWNDQKGFLPIGNVIEPFTGNIDGRGFAIHRLTINRSSEEYAGIIGYNRGGHITDLHIVDVDVNGLGMVGGLVGYNESGAITYCGGTGRVSGDFEVGGLVGSNDEGTVSNCHFNSTVVGKAEVGGLVGVNTGKVSDCRTDGKVNGGNSVGGIVGVSTGDLMRCFSRSEITGNQLVGGLVGDRINGRVSNCYSTGGVRGVDYVGGLIGNNHIGQVLSWCYASGPITGSGTSVGGLVGSGGPNGFAWTCYWDTEQSGQLSSDGGTSKTTPEMYQPSTFIGWDFDNIWYIDAGKDYPRLRGVGGQRPAGASQLDLDENLRVDVKDLLILLYGSEKGGPTSRNLFEISSEWYLVSGVN